MRHQVGNRITAWALAASVMFSTAGGSLSAFASDEHAGDDPQAGAAYEAEVSSAAEEDEIVFEIDHFEKADESEALELLHTLQHESESLDGIAGLIEETDITREDWDKEQQAIAVNEVISRPDENTVRIEDGGMSVMIRLRDGSVIPESYSARVYDFRMLTRHLSEHGEKEYAEALALLGVRAMYGDALQETGYERIGAACDAVHYVIPFSGALVDENGNDIDPGRLLVTASLGHSGKAAEMLKEGSLSAEAFALDDQGSSAASLAGGLNVLRDESGSGVSVEFAPESGYTFILLFDREELERGLEAEAEPEAEEHGAVLPAVEEPKPEQTVEEPETSLSAEETESALTAGETEAVSQDAEIEEVRVLDDAVNAHLVESEPEQIEVEPETALTIEEAGTVLTVGETEAVLRDEEAEPGETGEETETELAEEETEAETEPAEEETEAETESTEEETESETEPAEEETESETEPAEEETETEIESGTEFQQSAVVDGVRISVQAEAGVFPEGAVLLVKKVPARVEKEVEDVIEPERDEDVKVAVSYTYDIKVIGSDGEECQPPEGDKVSVSFSMAEAEIENLETQVYHITEEADSGELTAEKLEITEQQDQTVSAETTGFSYYTVEFIYHAKEYVLIGGNSTALSDILDAVGLKGEPEDVTVSNDKLIRVSKENDGWVVTSLEAFDTVESMTVMIDGIEYVITVTDTQGVAEYNGVHYATLQEALDAAVNGGEVLLLDSVTEAVKIKSEKTDLNLCGHTLTIPDSKVGIDIRQYGNLPAWKDITVREGTITGQKTSVWINTNNLENLKLIDLKFHNLTIVNGNNGIDIYNSDAVMENCEVDDCIAIGNASKMVAVNSGKLTMNNCSVTNCTNVNSPVFAGAQYKNISPTLKLNGCRITHNTGTYCGGISAQGSGMDNQWWAIINLTDTVITGNAATLRSYSSGGLTLSRGRFRMEKSAIYGNHVPENADKENSGPDVYVYAGWTNLELPDPSEMDNTIPDPKNMQDGNVDLTGYYWRDTVSGQDYKNGLSLPRNNLSKPLGLQVLRDQIRVVRNYRTNEEYVSLKEAVEAAEAEDTLVLCAAENGGGKAVAEAETFTIDRNLTIDLNGHHLNGTSATGRLFTIQKGNKVSIKGGSPNEPEDEETNEIDGEIDNLGELEISGAVSLKDRILHRGSRLFLSGGHNDIKATLDNGCYIEADPKLTMEKLEVYLLDSAEVGSLNERNHDHKDVLIVKGGSPLLESVTVTPQIDNPHVRRVHKVGDHGEGLYLVDKIPTGVYLDGVDGNDKNEGTLEKPVRTFARAKELLEGMIPSLHAGSLEIGAAQDGDTVPDGIYVLNTVEAEGTQTWSLPEGTSMIRYERNPHALVRVKGNLTLTDITLDGLSEGGVIAESPLIEVDGGTLMLQKGSALLNNTNTGRTKLTDSPKVAGGVLAKNGASIILAGGAVTGNEAGLGGGISLITGSSLTMKDGEISRNRAVRTYHDTNSDAAGGGVFLGGGTRMELSGGRISENHSDRFGGGISLGGYTTNTISYDKSKKATLNMTGGEIDDNVSSGNGGGIFLQGNTVGYISGGSITNNRANGARNGLFAGGGIYVNSNAGVSYLDYGELNLSNVLITENTARESGGGIGACPTSVTMVYVSSGAAVYGNSAPSAHDILIDAKTGANVFIPHIDVAHVAYISHYMLGGGEARWMRDGTELYNGPEGNHELMGHSHLTTHTSLELQCGAQQDAIDKALSLAKVTISGNYSGNRGGGIGNNGNIRIGTRWELEARKVWDDADDADGIRPESVTVQLRATVHDNGQTVEIPTESIPIDTVAVLSDENGWKHTWSDLPEVIPEDNEALSQYKNLEITYSIMEVDVPDGYTCNVTGNMFRNYTLTNTHQQELREIKVVKKWADAGYEGSRPEKITVELYEDGNATGKTLELTKNGNWSGQFGNLPVNKGGSRIRYSVREKDVPAGYRVSVSGDADQGFTLENTLETPPKESETTRQSEPQTEPPRQSEPQTEPPRTTTQTEPSVTPPKDSTKTPGDSTTDDDSPRRTTDNPTETTTGHTPPTGDTTDLLFWIWLAMAGVLGIAGAGWMLVRRRERR